MQLSIAVLTPICLSLLCVLPATAASPRIATTTTSLPLPLNCGDAEIDDDEECDDGGENSEEPGTYCSTACAITPCGSPATRAPRPSANDALFTLRAAVGLAVCSPYVCDMDGNGAIHAADALNVLKKSVGITTVVNCPAPEPPAEDITCVGRSFATVNEVFAALAGDYELAIDAGAGSFHTTYAAGSEIAMRVHESFISFRTRPPRIHLGGRRPSAARRERGPNTGRFSAASSPRRELEEAALRTSTRRSAPPGPGCCERGPTRSAGRGSIGRPTKKPSSTSAPRRGNI